MNIRIILKKPYLFAAVMAFFATFLFFTNMTNLSVPSKLTREQIVNSSRALNAQIANPQLSLNAKIFYRSHKITVLNYLALSEKIKSCFELKQIESTALSGAYNLYPTEKPTGQIFLCEFNGSEVSQIFLKDIQNPSAPCLESNTCLSEKYFNTDVNCNPTSGGPPVYCPAEGVYGIPQIVSTENAYCTAENFGFDQNGLWVKDGCKGVFRLNKLPQAKLAMKLLTWKYLGDQYQYRIDVRHLTAGQTVTKQACVSISKTNHAYLFNIDKSASSFHEFVFDGSCDDKTSVDLVETTVARVCYAPNRNWSTAVCSSYAPLKQEQINFPIANPNDVGNIVGYLDVAKVVGSNLAVYGWACHVGDARSITVQVHQVDQAKKVVFLGQTLANIKHEVGVSYRCLGGGLAHRFEVKIPIDAHLVPNSPLYAHGVSQIPGKNNTMLQNSGKILVPQILNLGKLQIDRAKIQTSRSALNAGEFLSAGEYLASSNKLYAAQVLTDGFVILSVGSGQIIRKFPAKSGTQPRLIMQKDGHLVYYPTAGSGVNVWATGKRVIGSRLVMQDDGNLVQYSADNKPVWSSFFAP